MFTLLKMAYRDLGRNRRRSILSSLALGVGLALLLLMAAVLTGEMRDAMKLSINLQSGHLQIRAKDYNEDKASLAWEDLVENPEQMAAQIENLAPVKVATPRLFASAIVTTGDKTFGVRVIGVLPDSIANAPFRDGLVSGEFIQADDREGIYIGHSLAEKAKLKAGDRVNLLVNTADGSVDEQSFVVRGTYSTGTPGFDQIYVFLPLAKAQAITRAENHASTVFILLNDADQTDAVIAALKGERYQVKTWTEMNQLIVQTEQFSAAYLVVLYLIILAITATVIINALIMSVYERTREIGILAAIGMKSRTIMTMFFLESTLLALGGIIIGLILGGLLVFYATRFGFYIGDFGITGVLFGERIYGYLTAKDAVVLSLAALVVTLIGSLYPAMLAARMEPVEALHGGK